MPPQPAHHSWPWGKLLGRIAREGGRLLFLSDKTLSCMCSLCFQQITAKRKVLLTKETLFVAESSQHINDVARVRGQGRGDKGYI